MSHPVCYTRRMKNMKLKLTRDEKEMIHLTTLVVYTFTLIGAAIVALTLL